MSSFETILAIAVLLLILCCVWMITEISALKKKIGEKAPQTSDAIKLRLQAYERLSILSERISLHDLLSRVPNAGLTSREMQRAMIDSIKQEYDYNVSQQIYVLPDIWKAIDNLKEHNIYVINQLASMLPYNASSMDLNKQIVEFMLRDPKAGLHTLVHEAINFEAQKLI